VKFSITSMAATAIVGIAVGGIATAPTAVADYGPRNFGSHQQLYDAGGAVADYPLAGRHPEPERPQR
jgi:hypothetical protein